MNITGIPRFENNCGKIWCKNSLFIVTGESDGCTTCCTIVTFVFKSFCPIYFCGIEWWILKCLDQCNFSISWILKSEDKHCRFTTTSSYSLVLPDFASKTFSSSSLGLSSFEVLWQETIWVDVIIPLSKNSRRKNSPKVIGVMSFCTKRSSTCTISCFLLGFFFLLSFLDIDEYFAYVVHS